MNHCVYSGRGGYVRWQANGDLRIQQCNVGQQLRRDDRGLNLTALVSNLRGSLHRYEARIAELERKVGQLVMENEWLKKTRRPAIQPGSAMPSVVSGPVASRSDEAANS